MQVVMSSDEFGEFVKGFGFKDGAEFHSMVARLDISTPERLDAFRRWQMEDGTKAGLERLTSPSMTA